MNNLIKFIERETGVKNLSRLSWSEIVDKVVLPYMAGPEATRWCINDMFMNFVADNAYAIYCIDENIANVLFEIALQRISCGAVLHEATSWPEPLPEKYWEYSSKWDEDHVMTQGCYNFIMKASPICLQYGDKYVKPHMQKILFGLMKYMSPTGEVPSTYYMIGKFRDKAGNLYRLAERLVEYHVSFDELYRNYAQEGQWQKHKMWFASHYAQINWNSFFKDTQCLNGNFIQRFRQRLAIKKELKTLSLPVAK